MRARCALLAAIAIVAPGHAQTNGPSQGSAPPSEPERAAFVGLRREPVYPLEDRPRAEGPVQASVEDEELARWNLGGTSSPTHPSSLPGFHPAARVILDTRVLDARTPERGRTSLSRSTVLARTRERGYWSARLCYENALRSDPKARGSVRVRMTIRPDGRVRDAHALGEPPAQDRASAMRGVASCLATGLREVSFRPAPGRNVPVEVTARLAPGDAPLPALPARAALRAEGVAPREPPEPRGPSSPAAPSRQALETALDGLEPRIQACFEAARSRNAAVWGRVALCLSTDAQTGAIQISEAESSFPDGSLVNCLIAVLGGSDPLPALPKDERWVAAYRLNRPEQSGE